jgi:ribosomal protein S2
MELDLKLLTFLFEIMKIKLEAGSTVLVVSPILLPAIDNLFSVSAFKPGMLTNWAQTREHASARDLQPLSKRKNSRRSKLPAMESLPDLVLFLCKNVSHAYISEALKANCLTVVVSNTVFPAIHASREPNFFFITSQFDSIVLSYYLIHLVLADQIRKNEEEWMEICNEERDEQEVREEFCAQNADSDAALALD